MKLMRSALACLLFLTCVSCRTTDATANLEELPKETAESLKPIAGMENVYASADLSKPIVLPSLERKTGVAFVPRKCARNKAYRFFVLYPVTVCQKPNSDSSVLVNFFKEAPTVANVPADKIRTINHKLSVLGTTRFASPLFCVTRSGPWGAELKEEEICADTELSNFLLTIPGVAQCPNCPSWVWTGTVESRPPEVHFVDFNPNFATEFSYVDCNRGDMTTCGTPLPSTPEPIR